MNNQPIDQFKPAEELELRAINRESLKPFTKVICPSCEGEVSTDNMNLHNSLAKCGNCNVIFSIEKEVERVKHKKEMRQEIFRPEGIDLFFYEDDLDITIQQHIQGIDIYGIVFLPIIAIFSILYFFMGDHSMSPFIPIVLSLGSLYFIYKGINYSKNKTYINITDKILSIHSRPKNLKKDRDYSADEIDQLYLKHSSDGFGHFTIHMLVNGMEGQKHVKLITVNTLSKAKYLEQEIEKYLNIEDRKIPEANVKI
jgi:hypothetical protein